MVALLWSLLACAVLIPIGIAAVSPLQASRGAAYIIGGMSGVVALAMLLLQPILAADYLPGARITQARRWHRWTGSGIVIGVVLHIGGLYLASPDDLTDALLLVAPTPFSVYGVIGLWSVILTALLVAVRSRLGLRHATWGIVHNALAAVVVVASVAHALMIEGAMGSVSKLVLSIGVLAATAVVIVHLRVLRPMTRRR